MTECGTNFYCNLAGSGTFVYYTSLPQEIGTSFCSDSIDNDCDNLADTNGASPLGADPKCISPSCGGSTSKTFNFLYTIDAGCHPSASSCGSMNNYKVSVRTSVLATSGVGQFCTNLDAFENTVTSGGTGKFYAINSGILNSYRPDDEGENRINGVSYLYQGCTCQPSDESTGDGSCGGTANSVDSKVISVSGGETLSVYAKNRCKAHSADLREWGWGYAEATAPLTLCDSGYYPTSYGQCRALCPAASDPLADPAIDAGYAGCRTTQPDNSVELPASENYCSSGACYKCPTGRTWDGTRCIGPPCTGSENQNCCANLGACTNGHCCSSGNWCDQRGDGAGRCCIDPGYYWDVGSSVCIDYDPCAPVSPPANPPANVGTNTDICSASKACCRAFQTGTSSYEGDCVSITSY